MENLYRIYVFVNDCYSKVVAHEDADIITSFIKHVDNNLENAKKYASYLPSIEKALQEDLKFFFDSDPAANSLEEIVVTYPGFLAIAYHRIAHPLYLLGYKVESRFISEQAHKITGIDIHSGASIDVPFFIDHGTGIVIGETAVVGKRVKIYQGVTLGALSLAKGQALKGTKRHPTIGDDVVLGSNVFITEDIPPHTKVTISKPVLVFKTKKID